MFFLISNSEQCLCMRHSAADLASVTCCSLIHSPRGGGSDIGTISYAGHTTENSSWRPQHGNNFVDVFWHIQFKIFAISLSLKLRDQVFDCSQSAAVLKGTLMHQDDNKRTLRQSQSISQLLVCHWMGASWQLCRNSWRLTVINCWKLQISWHLRTQKFT